MTHSLDSMRKSEFGVISGPMNSGHRSARDVKVFERGNEGKRN